MATTGYKGSVRGLGERTGTLEGWGRGVCSVCIPLEVQCAGGTRWVGEGGGEAVEEGNLVLLLLEIHVDNPIQLALIGDTARRSHGVSKLCFERFGSTGKIRINRKFRGASPNMVRLAGTSYVGQAIEIRMVPACAPAVGACRLRPSLPWQRARAAQGQTFEPRRSDVGCPFFSSNIAACVSPLINLHPQGQGQSAPPGEGGEGDDKEKVSPLKPSCLVKAKNAME